MSESTENVDQHEETKQPKIPITKNLITSPTEDSDSDGMYEGSSDDEAVPLSVDWPRIPSSKVLGKICFTRLSNMQMFTMKQIHNISNCYCMR